MGSSPCLFAHCFQGVVGFVWGVWKRGHPIRKRDGSERRFLRGSVDRPSSAHTQRGGLCSLLAYTSHNRSRRHRNAYAQRVSLHLAVPKPANGLSRLYRIPLTFGGRVQIGACDTHARFKGRSGSAKRFQTSRGACTCNWTYLPEWYVCLCTSSEVNIESEGAYLFLAHSLWTRPYQGFGRVQCMRPENKNFIDNRQRNN